jgi:CRP-like cAMP-binding protein
MRANIIKNATENAPYVVTGSETETVAYLSEGSIFGEVAIFTNLKRTATVTAL